MESVRRRHVDRDVIAEKELTAFGRRIAFPWVLARGDEREHLSQPAAPSARPRYQPTLLADDMNSPTHHPPKKLRKQYVNNTYPLVVMKFEDGHEIKVYQNTGKVFDVWAGETVKLMAVYDPTSKEWELIEAKKSDAFDDATS